MSSSPGGLDVREYGYSYFDYTVPDENGHDIACGNQWIITKIQIFAAENDALFNIEFRPPSTINFGGCLVLEPNGSYRGAMTIQGQNARIIVEYWWQITPDGVPPQPSVSP